ncbi:hypothetical protein SCG7109_AP_00190 [Chlamydiales bacterium SCGC AG-110-M15]|nr:hypothetical protein SCG7109_AP_00190 [Chlamydiales bacterium SCGC AG-110-M15]
MDKKEAAGFWRPAASFCVILHLHKLHKSIFQSLAMNLSETHMGKEFLYF